MIKKNIHKVLLIAWAHHNIACIVYYASLPVVYVVPDLLVQHHWDVHHVYSSCVEGYWPGALDCYWACCISRCVKCLQNVCTVRELKF